MAVGGYFESFAQKLCEYCMKNYVLPWMKEHGVVQSYRAQVVSVDHDTKTMVIQKPFDEEITLPFASGAQDLSANGQCLVFVLGEASNSIVVADGKGQAL